MQAVRQVVDGEVLVLPRLVEQGRRENERLRKPPAELLPFASILAALVELRVRDEAFLELLRGQKVIH